MPTQLLSTDTTQLEIELKLHRDRATDPLVVADLERYGARLRQIHATAKARLDEGAQIYRESHLLKFRAQVHEETTQQIAEITERWAGELSRQHQEKRGKMLNCLPKLDPAIAREIRDELRKVGDDVNVWARFSGGRDPQLLAAIATAPTSFPIVKDRSRVDTEVEDYARSTKPELAAEVDRLQAAVSVAESISGAARRDVAKACGIEGS